MELLLLLAGAALYLIGRAMSKHADALISEIEDDAPRSANEATAEMIVAESRRRPPRPANDQLSLISPPRNRT